MTKDISKLPFRQGVQFYILNDKKQFLIMNSAQYKGYWKIPAGGMEPGETPRQTLKRELKEELGIIAKVIKKSKHRAEFLWPLDLVKKFKYKFKGQQQQIFLVRMDPGQKIHINKKEICEYRWIRPDEVEAYFKLAHQISTAKKVLKEFEKYF